RPTAGDQAKHEIVRARRLRDGGDARGSVYARFVGNGMPAFVQLDAAEPGSVSVLNVDQPSSNTLPEHALRRLRHRRAGFSCPDHIDVVVPVDVASLQVTRDGDSRIGGIERSAEDFLWRGPSACYVPLLRGILRRAGRMPRRIGA